MLEEFEDALKGVQVHLSKKGADLHPKTGCLTAALLLNSGFTVPEMIELNRKVQLLRDGTRDAGATPVAWSFATATPPVLGLDAAA